MTTANSLLTDQITGHATTRDWNDSFLVWHPASNQHFEVTAYDREANLGTATSLSGRVHVAFRLGAERRVPDSRYNGVDRERVVEVFEVETVAEDGVIYAALGKKDARTFVTSTKAVAE